MADPRLFRLRVAFCKEGRLAMLSHLEVARALERTVRRARLPFAVSQGFSPHMRIAFGAALPVGVGGEEEFFDLLLERYLPPADALSSLQEASVDDLAVLSCHYVEGKTPSVSVALPLSTYEALLSDDVVRLDVPETVTMVRKKGDKELCVQDFLVGDVELSGRVVRFTIEAKPTGSLRPDAFLCACLDETVAAGAAPEGVHPVTITRVSQRAATEAGS